MNRLSSADFPAPFNAALLLVRHEDLAVVDRRALRDAGIRNIRVVYSGVEAARILSTSVTPASTTRSETGSSRQGQLYRESPELVLCHEQLADMTGDEFIRLIRLHPALLPFPIIMAVASDTSTIRARATESGYSGLLPRPYPQTALRTQLLRAAACRDATSAALSSSNNTDTSAFETALDYFISQDAAHSQDADKVYRSGLAAVRLQRWDESITTLQRASRLNPDCGKTLIALAAAWRGKGNIDKSSAMLQESVAVFVKNRGWAQAVAVSQRLIRENPGMPHPLQGEARRLLAAGAFKDAAQVLLCDESALDTSTTGKNGLYEQICRGCLANTDPQHAASELALCLAEAGHSGLGSALKTFTLERIAQGDLSSPEHFDSERTSSIELAANSTLLPALGAEKNLRLPRESSTELASLVPLKLETLQAAQTKTNAAPTKQPPFNAPASPEAIELLREPSTPSALRSFPRLSDALAVAKVTLGLFKAYKKM